MVYKEPKSESFGSRNNCKYTEHRTPYGLRPCIVFLMVSAAIIYHSD